MAVAAGHHTLAAGPVVTVSAAGGLNTAEGLRIVTPGVRLRKAACRGCRWLMAVCVTMAVIT